MTVLHKKRGEGRAVQRGVAGTCKGCCAKGQGKGRPCRAGPARAPHTTAAAASDKHHRAQCCSTPHQRCVWCNDKQRAQPLPQRRSAGGERRGRARRSACVPRTIRRPARWGWGPDSAHRRSQSRRSPPWWASLAALLGTDERARATRVRLVGADEGVADELPPSRGEPGPQACTPTSTS